MTRQLHIETATTSERGNTGEQSAAAYLLHAGYRIVEQNFRSKLGELDIVARDGSTLVFVEVRSRAGGSHGHAIEMVNIHKQRKVTRVAWSYIATRRPSFTTARFDVIGITGDELVHIKDAWRLGDGM
jgi:putative endonuclease